MRGRRGGVLRGVPSFLFSFLPLDCGFCPASGRGRLRGGRQGVSSSFFLPANCRLQPGIQAWSPARRAAGGRGASPSTPPTPPCPCGVGRHCRMSYPLSAARRRGQVGAGLGDFSLLFFVAGWRLQPGAWAWSPARRAAGGERGGPLYTPYNPLHPLVRVAKGVTVACRIPCPPLAAGGRSAQGWGIFPFYFSSLAGGFSPAHGLGRLRGGRQGVRGAGPSTPPTTPYTPLSVWRRASLSHVVYPVRRSPQGASRRASSRFAGDMRACCGAPAARGSPSRPARWAYGIFWGVRVERGERFTFSLRSETTGQRHVSSVGWLLPSIGAWSPARRTAGSRKSDH